jgi:hypothetical protein
MANRVAWTQESGGETLYERVSRQKHRWLKRVMFDHGTSSSQKCFAYVVVDRLNCVTLDSWPSQKTIANEFGWSVKTVHRVAIGLERRGYLHIIRNSSASYRYAPVFLPEDEDKSVGAARQSCPPSPDKNVEESLLGILTTESSPSGERNVREYRKTGASSYDSGKRGLYETAIARMLGKDGFDILERLSEHDDVIVERLCRAYSEGELAERELIAARLAADQLQKRRRRV